MMQYLYSIAGKSGDVNISSAVKETQGTIVRENDHESLASINPAIETSMRTKTSEEPIQSTQGRCPMRNLKEVVDHQDSYRGPSTKGCNNERIEENKPVRKFYEIGNNSEVKDFIKYDEKGGRFLKLMRAEEIKVKFAGASDEIGKNGNISLEDQGGLMLDENCYKNKLAPKNIAIDEPAHTEMSKEPSTITQGRRSSRNIKKPVLFAEDHRDLYRTFYNSTSETRNRSDRKSVVKDFIKYDEELGRFLKVMSAEELKKVRAASTKKRNRKSSSGMSKRAHCEEKKDSGSDSVMGGKRKAPSICISKRTNYGKEKDSNDIRLTKSKNSLWDLHDIDKKARIKAIKNHLRSNIRKRAVHVGEFFLFCHERQSIWIRRKKGRSQPWSKDEILNSRNFSNLYRELDEGTAFFRRSMIKVKNIVQEATMNFEQFELYFTAEVLFASLCHHAICKIETFYNRIGSIPMLSGWDKFGHDLVIKFDDDNAIFTATHYNMGFDRFMDTMEYLTDDNNTAIIALAAKILQFGKKGDLENCTKAIKKVHRNIGECIAWQIACDLMECGALKGVNEQDSEFVVFRDEASNGLAHIFGNVKDSELELCMMLKEYQYEFFEALGLKFEPFANRAMSLKVLEHALCEFHKYVAWIENPNASARKHRGHNSCAASIPLSSKKCANKDCRVGPTKFQMKCRCDTCWRSFCVRCYGDSSGISWICTDCHDLSRSTCYSSYKLICSSTSVSNVFD